MTHSKDNRHRREAESLGMPYGVAEKKLRLAVIHELAKQLGKNVCCRCGQRIESSDDIAIVHLQDWQDDPAQFWELTNVTFSHASCEAARGQEGEKKMRKVVIKIEDENGNQLPGVKHEGTIHVAATEGERYRIRVKNTTNKRVLAVITVDGRNIVDGKPGSVDGNGYVLSPYEEHAFDGWRQTDSTVAAFRFGKKEQSYSSEMGSPENVGVIGVAIFEEKEIPAPVITIRDRIVPMPYPVPTNPWIDPYAPWRPRPYWLGISDVTITSSQFSVGHSGVGSGRYSSAGYSGLGSEITCSVGSTMDSAPIGDQRGEVAQQLGTEYGETLSSIVSKTTFTRATEHPVEVWEVRYDSLEALQAQGIMSQPPSRRPKAPAAFPAGPKVTPGYCPAPPSKHARR